MAVVLLPAVPAQVLPGAEVVRFATSGTEAVLMAKRLRPKAHRLYVSGALHPEYLAVLRTYLSFQDGIEIASIAFDSAGRMYLAERGPVTGDYELTRLAASDASRSDLPT